MCFSVRDAFFGDLSHYSGDYFAYLQKTTKRMQGRNEYWDRERECERQFQASGPFFFITTENLDWLLYRNREEFKAGTNLVAIAAAISGLVIVGDIQMNNHHHVMGSGSLSQAQAFREVFREKMRRYQLARGNKSLKDWNIRIDETIDLKQFRSRIAYTNRNAYVVRKDSTPTGYPWGSGNLYYNGNLWAMDRGIPWEKVTVDNRRKICHSHKIDLPGSYRVLDNMILRSSFVDYKCTESLFNSANQYFTMLSRHGEADVEIAQILGEGIQLPNEEVFQIVGSWHGGTSLTCLSKADKYSAAKKMKLRLGSSNKQIVQVLQLPREEVDRLFPIAQ